MSQFAVIQLLGKQHKVAVGDTLVVDRLPQEVGKKFDVTDVLMIGDGAQVTVGQPLVEKATVTLSVQEQGRGEKIRVATYKAKSRSRKVRGHRQLQSTVKVEKIVG